MAIGWGRKYINTLDGAYLSADLFDGVPPRPGRMLFPGDEGRRLQSHKMMFDLDESGAWGWREDEGNIMDVQQLADYVVHTLLNKVGSDS